MKKVKPVQILLIILAVFVLIGVLIFVINPSKQLAKMRNDSRRSNAQNILNAAYQYAVDNDGTLPASITESPKMICR